LIEMAVTALITVKSGEWTAIPFELAKLKLNCACISFEPNTECIVDSKQNLIIAAEKDDPEDQEVQIVCVRKRK